MFTVKKTLLHCRKKLAIELKDGIMIPEGGYHPLGAAGASLIMDKLVHCNATHVCTAIGTGTTLAGLLLKSTSNMRITGIPVLKNMHDIEERLAQLHCLDQLYKPGYF
jgi:1-aminocyclopropane-1-carboxylate deaminase